MNVAGTVGNVSSTNTNSNNVIGSVVGGNTSSGTLIITTSTASDSSSIFNNDINTTPMSSTNANSIITNANSNQTISLGNLTKITASEKLEPKLNHNDGNTTTINR